jgi:fructokinase
MKKIFCIGELLIDFVAENQGNDLSRATVFTKKAGGAPANVACAISKLGGKSAFVGCIGDDPFGDFLLEVLTGNGVDTHLVQRSPTFTTLAFVSIAEDGERDFVFSRGADRELAYQEPAGKALNGNMLHLGAATALLGGPLETAYDRYFKDALLQGAFISFDPNFRHDLWKSREKEFVKKSLRFVEQAKLCKFSVEEARLLSGEADLVRACEVLHKRGAETIVITLGAEGTYLSTPSGQQTIASIAITPVDTTGAGDAFIGCLLYLLSREKDPFEAAKKQELMAGHVRIANAAGALTTTRFGAIPSLPDQEELKAVLQ